MQDPDKLERAKVLVSEYRIRSFFRRLRSNKWSKANVELWIKDWPSIASSLPPFIELETKEAIIESLNERLRMLSVGSEEEIIDIQEPQPQNATTRKSASSKKKKWI